MGLFSPKAPAAADDAIAFLNVGTQILTKDIMDQFIRSLGPHRTFYGVNAKGAKRILAENPINVVILEYDLGDSTAYRLIQELRANRAYDHLYFILAIPEESAFLRAIADELEVNAVLVKPFSANNIRTVVEKYDSDFKNERTLTNMLTKARNAFRDKAYTQAHNYYQSALKMAPNDARIHLHIGSYFLNKADLHSAEKHLNLANKFKPNDPQILTQLGLFYWKKNDFSQALIALTKAQELSPFNPERLKLLAELHVDWANELTKSSLRLDGQNSEVQLLLGKLFITQRDYLNAFQAFSKCSFSGESQSHLDAENERQALLNFTKSYAKIKED